MFLSSFSCPRLCRRGRTIAIIQINDNDSLALEHSRTDGFPAAISAFLCVAKKRPFPRGHRAKWLVSVARPTSVPSVHVISLIKQRVTVIVRRPGNILPALFLPPLAILLFFLSLFFSTSEPTSSFVKRGRKASLVSLCSRTCVSPSLSLSPCL